MWPKHADPATRAAGTNNLILVFGYVGGAVSNGLLLGPARVESLRFGCGISSGIVLLGPPCEIGPSRGMLDFFCPASAGRNIQYPLPRAYPKKRPREHHYDGPAATVLVNFLLTRRRHFSKQNFHRVLSQSPVPESRLWPRSVRKRLF